MKLLELSSRSERYCKDFKSGDRVIIGMRYKCGRCRYCLSARENLCERRPAPPPLKTIDGTIVTRWNVGGFAEYVSVPAYMAFKIPDGMSMEEASVVGCRVTTAYNAVKHRARLEPAGFGAGDRLRWHRAQYDSVSQMLRSLSDHRGRYRR